MQGVVHHTMTTPPRLKPAKEKIHSKAGSAANSVFGVITEALHRWPNMPVQHMRPFACCQLADD